MTTAAGAPPEPRRLEALVEALDLSEDQKTLLRSRWLEQLHWTSKRAATARRRYLAVRWAITCGSVILPALVSFSLGGGGTELIRGLTFAVSLVVALLAATEEVLHFGDAWHHYRRTAELLKSSGWQFVQLTGPYARSATHEAALAAFTRRVEDILAEDVDAYFGRLMADDPGVGRTGAG